MINSELKIFIKSYYIIESLVKEKVEIFYEDNWRSGYLKVIGEHNDYELVGHYLSYDIHGVLCEFISGFFFHKSYIESLKLILNNDQ